MYQKFLPVFIVISALLMPGAAQAIPAFSKKYEAPCSLCHASWPRLNDVGVKFKLNGYQMPGTEDGGERGKLSPASNLFLDIGSANPPVSIRLEGGLILMQPGEGPEKSQESKFFCCVEGNAVTVEAGGTVAPNIGFWLSLPWGEESVEQGYLRFVNWFSPGLVSMDIGVMKVVDYDVVGTGREWFGSPLVAFHGHPYNNNSKEIGLTAVHHDTGVRFYGRPKYDVFTYELGIYTGSQITSSEEDDSDLAFTIMGRVDKGKISASLRYWVNSSGKIDQRVTDSSGASLLFPADPNNTDEKTEEFILSARYSHPYFVVDFTMDRTSFSLDDRSVTVDETIHTLSQETINRTAFSLGVIWYVNSWFETGLAYGLSQYNDFTQRVDNKIFNLGSQDVGLIQLRAVVRPTMNMTIGLEFQMDTSNAAARKRADGAAFDSQNKLVLQWDLAL